MKDFLCCARRFSRMAALLLALFAGGLCAEEGVGEITFHLGEAWIVAADGARRAAAPAAKVFRGETLETGASGHLHVRFQDGGKVSVRPASRLVIEDYRDPGAGGAVRFRLERGVVRSLTGRYGEADRQRFRLNTPIAAIGVAGTDFVVEAEASVTRAAVFAGAIVAAPFGEDCRPEALGPCAGPLAQRLTEKDAQLMLEIRSSGAPPQLVPRNNFAALEEARKIALQPPTAKEEAIAQSDVSKTLPLPPPTFLWGRWAHAPVWEGDVLTQPSGSVGAERERVAENARYALYRLPQTAALPDAGRLELSLAAAQAHLVRQDGVLPAVVRDGVLALDFAARRFATSLTLESAATGVTPLVAAGAIRPDGGFSSITVLTRVQGAYGVGGSGPVAGYLFERATPQGMFMGIASWR